WLFAYILTRRTWCPPPRRFSATLSRSRRPFASEPRPGTCSPMTTWTRGTHTASAPRCPAAAAPILAAPSSGRISTRSSFRYSSSSITCSSPDGIDLLQGERHAPQSGFDRSVLDRRPAPRRVRDARFRVPAGCEDSERHGGDLHLPDSGVRRRGLELRRQGPRQGRHDLAQRWLLSVRREAGPGGAVGPHRITTVVLPSHDSGSGARESRSPALQGHRRCGEVSRDTGRQ